VSAIQFSRGVGVTAVPCLPPIGVMGWSAILLVALVCCGLFESWVSVMCIELSFHLTIRSHRNLILLDLSLLIGALLWWV
jgi:hypothetical protein